MDFVRACSEWASGLSLDAEQSIGGRQEAWFERLYKTDFVGACSEWASGLSLAAEQSSAWGQEPESIEVWSRSMDVAFLQVALF